MCATSSHQIIITFIDCIKVFFNFKLVIYSYYLDKSACPICQVYLIMGLKTNIT